MGKVHSIVLISCVKRKRNQSAQAKDLYDSALFRAQRAYAEHFADRWYILSAKYGLLSPETVIDPYEETLKGASADKKRTWSRAILSELEKKTTRDDVITITAGEDYCQYLVPLLATRGNEIRRPVKGLTMGYIPGRLYQLISADKPAPKSASPILARSAELKSASVGQSSHATSPPGNKFACEDHLDGLYAVLSALAEKTGGPRRLDNLISTEIPSRGVYFFFEDGEFRPGGDVPRIVRVGTHGLKVLSKSTLRGRLAQHRGTRIGAGNHRGSVFRLHIGKAIINRDKLSCDTWGNGSDSSRDVILAEQPIEKSVSDYIGKMKVILLDIPDEPQPDNRRGFIERNAIGLLAGKEPASKNWLGYYTRNPAIVQSHLWNVYHIGHALENGFLDCLKELALDQQTRE